MRTFAVAYVVLLGLWLGGLIAGIGWSGIFLGMAMVLFPAHVGGSSSSVSPMYCSNAPALL